MNFLRAIIRLAAAASLVMVLFGMTVRAEESDPLSTLPKSGVKLGVQEQAEVWGNLSGGRRRGTTANGLATFSIEADLGKLMGLTDWSFFANVFQIHGRSITLDRVGNLQTISNIEATRGTKLYNIWLAPTFFAGRLQMRIGQEGANDEMMFSQQAQLFLNSSFGFPALLAMNLPSGGPNYPIAAPMIRGIYKINDYFSVMGAVFNGDPAGPGPGDPQLRDRYGIAFRVNDPPLMFGELWFSPQGSDEKALPGLWKLGVWRHNGRFADQRFDASGVLLALPNSGAARMYRGNQAYYAIMDQMLWRRTGTSDQGFGVWALLMGTPRDRNVVDIFAEGGFTFKGPLESRPDDKLGMAFTMMKISKTARAFYQDGFLAGTGLVPLKPYELVTELTYLYTFSKNFSLQPSLQYVIHPGAGLPSPASRDLQIPRRNAWVLGVRAIGSF